jgi:hypothetical protein
MVDHFHEQVIDLRKIGGEARAMVVTSGIERAIQYFHAIRTYLEERKSPYKAIVAFSGEHDYGGAKVTGCSIACPGRSRACRVSWRRLHSLEPAFADQNIGTITPAGRGCKCWLS